MSTRILVIEETPSIRQLLYDILTEEGYEVLLETCSDWTYEEIRRWEPQLVLLDCILGADSIGWKLLRTLEADAQATNLPVIVCTVDEKEVARMSSYLAQRGVRWVLQPFAVDDLLTTIEIALQSTTNPALS